MTVAAPHLAVLAHPRHPVAEPFAGGMESHTWHLCKELTALGAHTTLYAPRGSDQSIASELRTYPELTLSATAARDETRPSDLELYQHHALMSAVAEIAADSRIDAVHNQTLHYLPIATSALLPPMVTTLHTPPFSWLESAIRTGGRGTGFVAVSRYIADEFSELLATPAHVIHNGVDTALFRPGPGGDDLAWTGRMVPEKAPHLAIDAARAAGRPLSLMGPIGDREYFDLQVRPRLGGTIDYLGHLDRRGVAAVLQQSAACLMTSVWPEPFGLSAAEAVCCGTPVIGFRVGGLGEVICRPELGSLVTAWDVPAMAAAVDRVVDLDRTATAATAARLFSLRRMASEYLELFAGLDALRGFDRAG
ncbi:glycosyltransferase [Nakamurella sp. A5-74]|uniref:Glycosyltransferase n=1 Tax=Nakamurella sp. A5-74 TaxID=3158264 RepID=A0AAU8DQU6_9ACTN